MKFICLLLISLLLLNCSKTNSTTQEADSTATDSLFETVINEEISEDDETLAQYYSGEGDSLVNAIRIAVDELAQKMEGDAPYTISARYSGYESGSESTWYFDSSMNLKYCKGSWDMEGTSGSYTYYFDGDDLMAYSAEDLYQESSESTILHTSFKPTYGFSTAGSEESTDTTMLYEEAYNSNNQSAREEFSKLLRLIRDNMDSATVSDQEVSIRIERVDSQNYGMDVTISENYSISKALFDNYIKE